jgi:hypothetical protein
MDDEEKRIAKALDTHEVPSVNKKNLLKYRKYLLEHLDKGTILTGREDFPWEEIYVFGPGNQVEYEHLKKKNPSYKDEYRLIGLSEEPFEDNDLMAQVERLSDKKRFEIGLSWLTTKDEMNQYFQLLDDFATWVVNWC